MHCKTNKFIYVHLPKCAGTFLKHFLLSKIYQDYKANLNTYDKEHDTRGEYSLEHIVNKNKLDPKSYFKFSIIRNPWDRVVSMYNFLGGKKYDYMISSGKERELLPPITAFHEFYLKDNFDGFVNYCFVLGKLRSFHSGYYDSYTNRLSLNGSLSVDKYYKQENINEAVSDLSDRFNFKDSEVFTDWRKNSSAAFRNKDNYRDYYSNWSREVISKHFLIDIDNFNYSF